MSRFHTRDLLILCSQPTAKTPLRRSLVCKISCSPTWHASTHLICLGWVDLVAVTPFLEDLVFFPSLVFSYALISLCFRAHLHHTWRRFDLRITSTCFHLLLCCEMEVSNNSWCHTHCDASLAENCVVSFIHLLRMFYTCYTTYSIPAVHYYFYVTSSTIAFKTR